MRKLILILTWAAATSGLAQGVQFQDLGWLEALAKARAEEKLVMVEAYVNWSTPSAHLDEYVLANAEVGTFFNQHFINVRFDMEAFPGVELAELYAVYTYPTLLFLNAEGELVHRVCGAVEVSEGLAAAKAAQAGKGLRSMYERFEGGERSEVLVRTYSQALAEACMEREFLVETFFEGMPEKNWTEPAAWAMIRLNVKNPFSPQFQYLLQSKAAFSAKYGKDSVEQKIMEVFLDQFIQIYEGEDVTLFATQALQYLMKGHEFAGKEPLAHMMQMQVADLREDWPAYARSVIQVVVEQQVTDPDQLNEFAWKFYLYVTDNAALSEARLWMEEVIATYPQATYLDTYASLLFKLGSVKEARNFAKKALQAAEFEGEDTYHFQQQLELFQTGN